MEPKTLKDLPILNKTNLGKVIKLEIKAEAVKWVKRARNKYQRGNTADAIDFMEFHNITEKDLNTPTNSEKEEDLRNCRHKEEDMKDGA